MTVTQLRQMAMEANDGRIIGRFTREQHAVIIARIDSELIAAGLTWEDLA